MNVNVSMSDEIIKVLDYLFDKFGIVAIHSQNFKDKLIEKCQ